MSLKGGGPRPCRRQDIPIPRQSFQSGLQILKLASWGVHHFAPADAASRPGVPQSSDRCSIQSAITNEGFSQRFLVAIQRAESDGGSEFGTDFTWHQHELGMKHRHISRGCAEGNG